MSNSLITYIDLLDIEITKTIPTPTYIGDLKGYISLSPSLGDCVDQPCMNGGRCTEQLQDFTCKCASQYYGKTCTSKFKKYTSLS